MIKCHTFVVALVVLYNCVARHAEIGFWQLYIS